MGRKIYRRDSNPGSIRGWVIPSAIVGQLEEHEGDRELEREMRDAGVDLEAEATQVMSTSGPQLNSF